MFFWYNILFRALYWSLFNIFSSFLLFVATLLAVLNFSLCEILFNRFQSFFLWLRYNARLPDNCEKIQKLRVKFGRWLVNLQLETSISSEPQFVHALCVKMHSIIQMQYQDLFATLRSALQFFVRHHHYAQTYFSSYFSIEYPSLT